MGELSNRFEQAAASTSETPPAQTANMDAANNDEIFSVGIGKNFDAAYASGRSVLGTPMIAIATPEYTVVYQPAAAEFGADSWIGDITYKNGDRDVIWPSGESYSGNPQSGKDFFSALELLKTAAPVYVPESTEHPVSAGALADKANAELAEQQAFIADLKARYPAATATAPAASPP